MKRLTLFILLTALCPLIIASPVTIKGTSVLLKNRTIEVTYKKEGYTQRDYTLAKQTCTEKGTFNVSFEVNRTEACYIELGKYKGLLFAEPGKSYTIDLSSLDTAKLNNPLIAFEKPELIILGLKPFKNTDLQYQISLFEEKYAFYQNQVMLNADETYAQQVVDASINELNKLFATPIASNEYLKDYIQCKYALLEMLLPNKRGIVVTDYLNKPIKNETNNPAFWELNTRMWSHHLDELGTQELPLYERAITTSDTKALQYIFSNHVGAKDLPWVNWALLEILYNEKTGTTFPTETILSSLSAMEAQSTNKSCQLCCRQLIEDASLMRVGTPYPINHLPSIKQGEQINLTHYKGKILVLYYFNPAMSTTKTDLENLKTLKQKSQGKLEVVAVVCFNKNAQLQSKLEQYKYDIHFALCSDRNTLYQFQVFDLPTTQLYDTRGNVLEARASNPSNGLSVTLNKYYRTISQKQKTPFN